MLHRCSIIKESRQSWSWKCHADQIGPVLVLGLFEVLGMFGYHHVHHNVPLGSKFIEDSDLCGQMNVMEDRGEEVVIDTETECIIHKRRSTLHKELWAILWTSHCWQKCCWHVVFNYSKHNVSKFLPIYHRLDRFMSSVISVVATSKVHVRPRLFWVLSNLPLASWYIMSFAVS